MFVLTVIDDKLKIAPEKFSLDPTEALIEQINTKFVNKVLLEVGLCVCFYDFIEVGDPYIYPAEGSCHQLSKFRLVIFRPFVGEVIVGRIRLSSAEGIHVSLKFFDDIFIPNDLLQSPSIYDEKQSIWIWKYDDEESEFKLFNGEEIRFRVRTIKFTRSTSTAKGIQTFTTSESQSDANDELMTGQALRRRSSSLLGVSDESNVPPAMQVIGCINDDGLGIPSWWNS